MTDQEFRARLDALLTRNEEMLRKLQTFRQRLFPNDDDASGALGVRAPLSPRGPAPRTDAIAVPRE